LAVTATGPRQMSSGCYCGTQSGQYNTCLADLFSAAWMEDLDAVCREFYALAIHLNETNLFELNNTFDMLTHGIGNRLYLYICIHYSIFQYLLCVEIIKYLIILIVFIDDVEIFCGEKNHIQQLQCC